MSNWRRSSKLAELGTGYDNIKLNIKKRNIEKYKVTNAREIAQLIEKLK
jgi:hypothetical protein